MVYRPNEAKVRNLKTKDYLGKARLVATTDRADAYTGFSGPEMMKVRCFTVAIPVPSSALFFFKKKKKILN